VLHLESDTDSENDSAEEDVISMSELQEQMAKDDAKQEEVENRNADMDGISHPNDEGHERKVYDENSNKVHL
jgi:hypothetical protein